MNEELKPCPFCGGLAIRLLDVDDYTSESYNAIKCKICGARTKYFDELYTALEAWNRRADNA